MEWERIEGEREARGLDAFYRLGREYITMQGLLIETRNDLPATFHSTFIPRHFSLSAELTLYEISRFSPTLFASDIYFSFPPPPPSFFQLFRIDHGNRWPLSHPPRCHLAALFHP